MYSILKHKPRGQMSESFFTAALLSLSGGYRMLILISRVERFLQMRRPEILFF